MKSRFSKRAGPALFTVGVLLAGAAHGLEFKSVEAPAAILYDAPSAKGKKLFLLRRYTPLEVIVSVEGFIKVREPDGAIGWAEKKLLADKRQVLVTAPKAQVRATPAADAGLVFEAEKGVALELLEPPRDGWIKVRHLDGPSGMVRVTQVWGL